MATRPASGPIRRPAWQGSGLPTPQIVLPPPAYVVRLRQTAFLVLVGALLGASFVLGRWSARIGGGDETVAAVRQESAPPAVQLTEKPIFAEAVPAAAAPAPAAIGERSPPGPATGLRIEGFAFQPKGDGSYRYRLKVANEGEVFRGALQFEITALAAGEKIVRVLPEGLAPSDGKFRLEVRRYLRTEGDLPLPASWKLVQVEARLVQQGNLRASQALAWN